MSATPARKTLAAFAALQAADTAACAIPLKFTTDALEQVRFPMQYRWIFPLVKGASAAALALGVKFPPLARLTLAMLTLYFLFAVGSHLRVRDSIANTAPAAALLGIYSFLAARSCARE